MGGFTRLRTQKTVRQIHPARAVRRFIPHRPLIAKKAAVRWDNQNPCRRIMSTAKTGMIDSTFLRWPEKNVSGNKKTTTGGGGGGGGGGLTRKRTRIDIEMERDAKKQRSTAAVTNGPRQQVLRKRRRSEDDDQQKYAAASGWKMMPTKEPTKTLDTITKRMEKIRVGSTYPDWLQDSIAPDGKDEINLRIFQSPVPKEKEEGVLMPLYRPPSHKLGPDHRIIDLRVTGNSIDSYEECEEDEDGCIVLETPGAKKLLNAAKAPLLLNSA